MGLYLFSCGIVSSLQWELLHNTKKGKKYICNDLLYYVEFISGLYWFVESILLLENVLKWVVVVTQDNLSTSFFTLSHALHQHP